MVYCVNVGILAFLVGIHCFVASLASKICSRGGLCRPFVRRADSLMVRSIFQLNSNKRNVECVFPHAHPLVELDSSGTRHEAVWDSSSERFVDKRQRQFNFRNFFLDNFYPGGTLAPDYYRYAGWRATQRLISATNGVFGTQALIMALGIKKKHLGRFSYEESAGSSLMRRVSKLFISFCAQAQLQLRCGSSRIAWARLRASCGPR